MLIIGITGNIPIIAAGGFCFMYFFGVSDNQKTSLPQSMQCVQRGFG